MLDDTKINTIGIKNSNIIATPANKATNTKAIPAPGLSSVCSLADSVNLSTVS